MAVSVDSFITELEVNVGKRYTDEQRDFIRDITKPVFVFASPGTGKTQSAVGALITAELYHKIPGDTIYALSFTNKATSELAVRHKLACDKLGIKQRVKFNTLHKCCSDILSENYRRLGIDSYQVAQPLDTEEMHHLILNMCSEYRISLSPDKVKDFINAMKTLNSTLVFDRAHVENSVAFLNTGLDYESFTKLRTDMYNYSKLIGKVDVSDILLYTLELLLRCPDVSSSLKSKCRIMLVDEAQDLSLLQLGLVNSFTDCPVLIGDQKQQIYGFQGACPEIKHEYFRLHPEARELTLSKSFRCLNNIADYATPLILKNNVGGKEFTGCGEGGIVEEVNDVDVASICEGLHKYYDDTMKQFTVDVLFLYRNNYSAMPLIEELYKQNIPFRSYKYPGAINIPFVREMSQIIDFVRAPRTPGLDRCLRMLIPEFRGTTGDTPLTRVAKQLDCSPLDVNYAFKNEGVGYRVMSMLVEIEEMLKKGDKLSDIFNTIWPIFYDMWGAERERYTDRPSKYYLALAAPVVRGKTYDKFIQDERNKVERMNEFEKLRIGVRCYTMHAAKGLEADIVHIIDADEGIIPNERAFERMLHRKCYDDAAKLIRNERSLVYVAVTRARKELYIHKNPMSKLSPLFDPSDTRYDKLDTLYENTYTSYNDIEEFSKFTKEGGI